MAIGDRTPPTIRGNLGKYNNVHLVANSTTFFATGSNEAAAFVVDGTTSQITLHFQEADQPVGMFLMLVSYMKSESQRLQLAVEAQFIYLDKE